MDGMFFFSINNNQLITNRPHLSGFGVYNLAVGQLSIERFTRTLWPDPGLNP